MAIDLASDERLMMSGRCQCFVGERYVRCDIQLTDKRIVVSSLAGEHPSLQLEISLGDVLDTWRSLKEESATATFEVRTARSKHQFLLDDPQAWRATLGLRLGILKGPAALPNC